MLQCNYEDDNCGKTKFEIREEFESKYPFLGNICSPGHCECELMICGIREDDIVDVADGEEDDVNMDDVADQYLHSMLKDEPEHPEPTEDYDCNHDYEYEYDEYYGREYD